MENDEGGVYLEKKDDILLVQNTGAKEDPFQ